MKSLLVLLLILAAFMVTGFIAYDRFLGSNGYVIGHEYVYSEVTTSLPAVTGEEAGTLIKLSVFVKQDHGKILMNIDNPSFILDTQDSMRLAVQEAMEITGNDPEELEVMFSLDTNTSIIGGPSAGAAMTVATAASLMNRQLDPSIVITGEISPGGFIKPVGGVKEKATAAKEAGMRAILVPVGEGEILEPFEKCTEQGDEGWSIKSCVVAYNRTSIESLVGIDVIEVSTVQEAMEYMLA